MDSQDRLYQDAQRALFNALTRSQPPAQTCRAVRQAMLKFEQVRSGHRYASEFVQLCHELVGKLEGGNDALTRVEALLAATRSVAEREAQQTAVLQERIAELEKQAREAEEERRGEAERREAELRRSDFRNPANWPGMLVRKLPSALGGKGAAFLVSFLLLRPIQHALCDSAAARYWLGETLPALWELTCRP